MRAKPMGASFQRARTSERSEPGEARVVHGPVGPGQTAARSSTVPASTLASTAAGLELVAPEGWRTVGVHWPCAAAAKRVTTNAESREWRGMCEAPEWNRDERCCLRVYGTSSIGGVSQQAARPARRRKETGLPGYVQDETRT